jgi:peptidoglycan/LPS O-acetylase OafA/YrhL
MDLLLTTFLLLISAVAIGFYLAYLGTYQRRRSPGLGLTHAGLALAGSTVLFTEIFTSPIDKLNNVTAIFLFFAILGGGMVFLLHEKNRPPAMAAACLSGVTWVEFLL